MAELKPCPFCGNRADIFVTNNENIFVPVKELSTGKYHSIRCASCFSGTGLYTSLNRAIEIWNRRDGNG